MRILTVVDPATFFLRITYKTILELSPPCSHVPWLKTLRPFDTLLQAQGSSSRHRKLRE